MHELVWKISQSFFSTGQGENPKAKTISENDDVIYLGLQFSASRFTFVHKFTLKKFHTLQSNYIHA